MENNKTPSIRFKGFTDPWEQRKVTALGEVYIGLVTTMTAHYTNQGTLLIRNSDIKDGKFEFDSDPIYLDKEFAEQNKSRMHKIGDVITVHTGDIGTSAVISENEVNSIGFATIVTRPNPELLDSNYLSTFLNTDQHKAWAVQMSTGDGRTNYNLKDYTELIVPVPKLEEQRKIASFILNLNDLITLHQRKYNKLLNVKKSMLEKMFPKNGSNIPEIRFKGFTDPWEQRKAKNLFVSTADKGHPELPVLSATQDRGMIRRDENSINIYHDKKNEEGYKRVLPGQFVIHLRSFQGGFAHSAIEGITSPAYTVFGFSEPEKHNPNYWKYVFTSKEFIRRLETVTYGIRDGRSISYDEFLTMDFVYPMQDEQIKIANYLDTLDNLITLHQRELEKLQNIKKSMLEKMFV